MNADDLILISVDDHIVEPPDVFENHLPAKYRDIAPRIERMPDGTDRWKFLDFEIPNVGLNAVTGRPPEEYGMDPTSFDELVNDDDCQVMTEAEIKHFQSQFAKKSHLSRQIAKMEAERANASIDIGDVDLVCQVGSPRSIGVALRAGAAEFDIVVVEGMPPSATSVVVPATKS